MLINKAEASDQIEKIADKVERLAIRLIVDDVTAFYRQAPSQLLGDFDLAFLVNVLEYDLDEVKTLLQHETPQGYWDDPSPEWFTVQPVNSQNDASETGLRPAQAHNFCGSFEDSWLGYVLLSLLAIVDLKQNLVQQRIPIRHHTPPGIEPAAPAAPASPLDQLFFVQATRYALRLGSPARLLLEGKGSGMTT